MDQEPAAAQAEGRQVMGKPKVPNTISDKKMAELRRRAAKGSMESWISGRAVARRLAASKQASKSRWS